MFGQHPRREWQREAKRELEALKEDDKRAVAAEAEDMHCREAPAVETGADARDLKRERALEGVSESCGPSECARCEEKTHPSEALCEDCVKDLKP